MDTLPDGVADLLRQRNFGIGTLVAGRYRLTQLLGEGAMGTVYVAQNEAIHMPVAIKMLRPELLANPEFRKRFQKEADAVAAVHHPNVARFYDLVVGDPTFLVMEYVQGETLSALLSRGRMQVDRAVRIAAALCWGLDAAHAAGVIHRDLKPPNIILEPDRRHGEVPKIIDFGLAKVAAHAEAKQLTRQGQIVGTPHYMSPEQISGAEVDARADIYGLACVLYEMLTGQAPFEGVEGDVQVLYRQMHEPPEPPSRTNPDVPPRLDAIVLRALAKRPEDRYSDIRDLARALDHVLEPVEVTASTVIGRRRPGWPVVVGVAAVAAAAGVLLGMKLPRSQPAAEPPAAVAAPEPQAVLVVTEPPGAQVSIDGTPVAEPTPTWAAGLTTGRHTVRIEKAGHGAVDRVVDLGAGEREVVHLIMPPPERELVVHTNPDGALLYLDGNLVTNATPATVRVTEDFHQLRAELPGYEVATRNLAPEDRDTEITIPLEVERQPRGIVMIDSDDAADILVDGAETGFTTATLGLFLPVGPHTVQLRDSSGRHSRPARVQVDQGAYVRLTLNLER